MALHVVGDPIVLTNTFKVSGTATDPDTVTLAVTDPSGNTDTYTYADSEITKSSTGVYTKTVTVDEAGWWTYKWTGTGAAADVEDGEFRVWATRADWTLPVRISELESSLQLTFDTSDRQRAELLLQSVYDEVQSVCTRDAFTRTSDDEVTLRGNWTPRLYLPNGPIVSVSTVVLNLTTLNSSSYRIVGRSLVRVAMLESTFGDPIIRGLHWGGPERNVTVTYTHGHATIPSVVKSVCLRAAERAWANPGQRKRVQLASSYAVDFPDVELSYLTRGDLKSLGKYMLTPENAQ